MAGKVMIANDFQSENFLFESAQVQYLKKCIIFWCLYRLVFDLLELNHHLYHPRIQNLYPGVLMHAVESITLYVYVDPHAFFL